MYNNQASTASASLPNNYRDNLASNEFQGSAETGYGYDANTALTSFWKILYLLRKWWWLIALITITLTALTAYKLSQITPMYNSAITLEVKQQERNIVGGASDSAIENISANRDFFTTQIELLKSNTLAENVIENLNLISDPDFSNPNSINPTALPREKRISRLVGAFKSKLKVAPVQRSRLIRLSFEHSNPDQAALIANNIAETFINNTLQRKFNASAYARDFLEARLAAVKTSLEIAERELVEYAAKNDILIIENANDNGTSSTLKKSALVALDEQLILARTEHMKARQAYTNSQQQGFVLEILENNSLNSIKEDKIALESEYKEKLATFKPSFPEMLELKSRIELFEQTISSETTKIVNANREKLRTDYELAKAQEEDLARRVSNLKTDVVNLRERSIDYTILSRKVDTERTQYEALLQRLKEVSVSEDISSNLVEIVDPARAARSPFKPNKRRTLILALILSSALGFSLAYAIEVIDDRIKQPEDIKTKLGKTTFGVIPQINDQTQFKELLIDPQESIAEAYATVRTNIQFSAIDGGPRIIQITSTQPGEGKSVSSMGLAMRFAGLGEKTLLIDADMRRPTFRSGNPNAIGLSGLLTSHVDIGDHITPGEYENLFFITSGAPVPNPSEILSSERFSEILAYARKHFSYVIVDSPPVIGLADAPILGAKVDATLLVVEANNLRVNNIRAAMDRLSISGTHILGVVMTKYRAKSNGYSYYQYSYGKQGASYEKANKKDSSKVKSKTKFSLG